MTKAAQELFQIVLFACINKMQAVTDNECREHYTCYLNPMVFTLTSLCVNCTSFKQHTHIYIYIDR